MVTEPTSRARSAVEPELLVNIKARREAPAGYARFHVPGDRTSWDVSFPNYRPNCFTDPSVLANDITKKRGGWAEEADPQKASARRGPPESLTERPIRFEANGLPLNPAGRTGTAGRGLLGKWGPNFAADPIVTRVNPKTGELEMLAIRRKDNGQWAIPGGMVDHGEAVSDTLAREFREEAGVELDMGDARLVYRGYVDDRRNTDNAWMETTVKLKHLDPATAAKIKPRAGDDAAAVRWMPLTERNLANLYASHGHFVRSALALLKENGGHPNPAVRGMEDLVAAHTGSTVLGRTR